MEAYKGKFTVLADNGVYECTATVYLDENARLDLRFNHVLFRDDKGRLDEVRLPQQKLEMLARDIIAKSLCQTPFICAEYEAQPND